MILEQWGDVLTRSFQDIWLGVASFIPQLVVAVIIFVVGWVVGVLLGRVVSQIIRSLKVDNALKSLGVEDVLSRAGFRLDSGRFIGELVKWFLIIVFLVATLDVLGLTQVNTFLQQVVLAYIPQVIVAALVLLIAAVIADAMQKIVVGAAKAADVAQAPFLGGVTKWAIWVFAILIALSHLGIGDFFAQTLFTGVVVALSIGFGLAFGLGGQGTAGEFLQKLRKDIRHD
jgi:small-conductance mechanosensitive channel